MVNVYLLADIEGSHGIWRRRQCHAGRPDWWQIGRQALTEDVKAVITGIKKGGGNQITVRDVHDRGFNLLVSQLPEEIGYIGGFRFNPYVVLGPVPSANIGLLVAQHARSGSNGFFAHTMSGIFSEVRLDGRPIGEVTIFAAALGDIGIPIGMVSGDKHTIEEGKKILPWSTFVEVPKLEPDCSSVPLSTQRQSLQKMATKAVEDYSKTELYNLKGPMKLELEFQTEEIAKKKNTWKYTREGKILILETVSGLTLLDDVVRIAYYSRKTWRFRRIYGKFRRWRDKRKFYC